MYDKFNGLELELGGKVGEEENSVGDEAEVEKMGLAKEEMLVVREVRKLWWGWQ